jgi:hypothetical protein
MMDLHHQAYARRDDRATSHEAADKVSKVTGKHALAVLCYAKQGFGFTDEFICDALTLPPLNMTPSSIRSRRAKLTEMGLIAADGDTTNSRGNRVTVWRITDKGKAVDVGPNPFTLYETTPTIEAATVFNP